jgi:hypothetical protein
LSEALLRVPLTILKKLYNDEHTSLFCHTASEEEKGFLSLVIVRDIFLLVCGYSITLDVYGRMFETQTSKRDRLIKGTYRLPCLSV